MKAVTDLRVNQVGLETRIKESNGKFLLRARNEMVKIMKEESKFKGGTGRFKRSIKIFTLNKTEGNGVLTATIGVGATALHAKYVVRKTRPSQGAYVPALGGRQKFGTHPGTPKNDVIVRSKPRIEKKLREILLEEYDMKKINIMRFIKNG